MSNRKFIHRTFLAAALTMSAAPATTASGFEQAQYQPGKPGQQIPQNNSKVTQELNRMFQENGQQMPSMNAKELPNANVATQGQIRPVHSPNQLQVNTISSNNTKSKQTDSPRKQSALGRFFGKLRGDQGNNNPDYQPPVPPESTGRAVQVQNGTAIPVPPRSGATTGAANAQVPARKTSDAAGQRIEYTQPGSAPGFMSSASAGKVIQKQPLAVPPSGAKVLDDTFEAPFGDSAESLEETEILDLDSLIEIPAASPQPVTNVGKEANPLEHSTAQATPGAQVPAKSASEFADESVAAPEENPFTGVQLNPSDEQFFENPGPSDGVDADAFGDPAAPMEDFNSNLPAINSTSVDLPPIDNEAAGSGFDLIETSAAEPVQPTEGETPEKSTTPANSAGRAELQPNVDDSNAKSADVPEAMSAAETARLGQIAEQERRQLQQRQIQARAGQTGFKGFCPVALRERRELADANDQFTSTFGLQTYKFSSAESKAAFDIDPSRYAPAAGGNDLVVLVNSGEEQAGQLDYALWYRDRLYLFRSRETMTLFSKDPQRFASQY